MRPRRRLSLLFSLTPLYRGVCFAVSSSNNHSPILMGDLAERDDGKQQENADMDGTNDSSHSKKRSRPETVALQLLELAGSKPTTANDHKKRLKSIVIPSSRTSLDLRQPQQPDSLSTRTSTGTVPRGNAKTPSVAAASSLEAKDDATVETNLVRTEVTAPPQQEQSDGQFDDASEGEDTPNVDFFAAPSTTRVCRPLLVLTTTPAVLQAQPPPRQVAAAPTPLYPPFPALPPEATTFWGAFQPIAPRVAAPRPTKNVPHPAARGSKPKQFSDGPLKEKHPNPLLLPDSRVEESARLRPMPAVASDVTTQQRPVHAPLPTDILLGRGGRSNNHVGNLWFREFIHAYRPAYQRLGKFNKMQLATNLVNYVRHCGGRFLQKIKTPAHAAVPEVWWEVGDAAAIQKCSQCLREQKANSPIAGSTANKQLPRKPAAAKGTLSKSRRSSKRKSKPTLASKASSATNTMAPNASSATTVGSGSVASRRPSTSSSTIATNVTGNNSASHEDESKSEQGNDNDNDSLGVLEI